MRNREKRQEESWKIWFIDCKKIKNIGKIKTTKFTFQRNKNKRMNSNQIIAKFDFCEITLFVSFFNSFDNIVCV